MHVPGHHPGTCPDIVPGPVLHVHGEVPVPRTQDDDSGNDGLGADLILTYGPQAQKRPEEAHIQKLQDGDLGPARVETACSGAEGTRTGVDRRVHMTRFS